jgi:hypothetical protein
MMIFVVTFMTIRVIWKGFELCQKEIQQRQSTNINERLLDNNALSEEAEYVGVTTKEDEPSKLTKEEQEADDAKQLELEKLLDADHSTPWILLLLMIFALLIVIAIALFKGFFFN